MSTNNPSIPADVAAHVLSHYGREGGYPAGDWTESLISLIDRADMTNRAKLAGAFPGYGAAVLIAKYDDNGVAYLQDIAAGRCTRCKQDDGPIAADGRCEACAQPMPLDGLV